MQIWANRLYGCIMTIHRLVLLLAIALPLMLGPAAAQVQLMIDTDSVRICPAKSVAPRAETSPPDFSDPSCAALSFWEIDTQGRALWMQASITIPAEVIETSSLSVVISGKAASAIYVNGAFIGRNGAPGEDAQSETPGRMDAGLPIRPGVLKPGKNKIIAYLSGHHSIISLRHPMHGLGVTDRTYITDSILRAYWPSLLTFGAFILGALYFAVSMMRGPDRFGALLLMLISFFAAGQLFTEASRGLFAYAYPVHDIRLLLIVVFSVGFGLCLSAYVARAFFPARLKQITAASAVAMIAAVLIVPGFDGKAALSVLLATLISAGLSIAAAFRRQAEARRYSVALSIFAALILFFPSRFLDVLFFYAVAALLLFLFGQQAIALAREQTLRRAETERAKQLEQALAQAAERTEPAHISLKNSGAVERIATDRIVQFKGAGDYVAVDLTDGGQILHSGSLVDLEKTLPPSFLRVHRSHIVNTALVQSLKREGSGVGELTMTVGDPIPVSRRIMPKVRSALG